MTALNEFEKVQRLSRHVILRDIYYIHATRNPQTNSCCTRGWLTSRPSCLCRLAAFGEHEIFGSLGNRIHVDTADLKACCCLMNELPRKITTPAAKVNEKNVALLAQSGAGNGQHSLATLNTLATLH